MRIHSGWFPADSSPPLIRLRTEHVLALRGSAFTGRLDLEGLEAGGFFFAERGQFNKVNLLGAKVGIQLVMNGSTFTGLLQMGGLQVGGSLFMSEKASFGNVNLTGARVGDQLTMNGSTFTGPLIMNGLRVERSLQMRDGATFAGEINLRGATVGDRVEMRGSTFSGTVRMDGMQIGGALLMDRAKFADVELIGAKVGGQLAMNGSTFTGQLVMNSTHIAGPLLMRDGAQFAEINLVESKVGGQLAMNGSNVTGPISMNSLQVNGSLYMNGSTFSGPLMMQGLQLGGSLAMHRKAKFATVDMRSAKIEGQIDMGDGSEFFGPVMMDSVRVGTFVVMRRAQFAGPLVLSFVNVDGSLDLEGSILSDVNLGGARIRGGLSLANVQWPRPARLILRNTQVGSWEDLPLSGPTNIEMTGFRYQQLGRGVADGTPFLLIGWLARQENYSPEPYEQLADALRRAGHGEKAKDILVARGDRERNDSKTGWGWSVWLWLYKVVLGYGQRPLYALGCALVLVVVGIIALCLSDRRVYVLQRRELRPRWLLVKFLRPRDQWLSYFEYSVDRLGPGLRLREQQQLVALHWLGRLYFWVHAVAGYVLAVFVIGFIAGLIIK